MAAYVDIHLLLSVTGWISIGLAIGRGAYAALVRRDQQPTRADLPVAHILGLVGANIGGAVGWSMHGTLNEVAASLIGALLGALLLCVIFQFIVPV